MTKIFRGRLMAQIDGPFVVFIIGMRVNKLMMIGKWLPVARAMGLAAAAEHVPAIGARETARRRLGFKDEPAAASYENPGQPWDGASRNELESAMPANNVRDRKRLCKLWFR